MLYMHTVIMSDPTSSQPADFQRRFYYLLNFERALEWLADRYDDLWVEDDRDFLREFPALPLVSRALLVRMVMRVGPPRRAPLACSSAASSRR